MVAIMGEPRTHPGCAASPATSGGEGNGRGSVKRQRDTDDCTICAISMATGLSYEAVMEVAANSVGGYRYQGTPGTMSPRGVLMDLGFDAQRVPCAGVGGHVLRKLLWGRRAILSVPSLNGFPGHHDVYWDGHRLYDPSPKAAYGEAFPAGPIWAVVLDERPQPQSASPHHTELGPGRPSEP
jgi:hypothetical protein